jgi:hypothetical protein
MSIILLALQGVAGLFDDVGLGKTTVALSAVLGVNEIVRRNLERTEDGREDGLNADWPPPKKYRSLDCPAAIDRLLACAPLTKYKPVLVVCPATATKTWTDEITQCFPGLTIKYWYGQANQMSGVDRERHIRGTAWDLINYVQGLDALDPATGRIIIITTLQTFRTRTLVELPMDFFDRYNAIYNARMAELKDADEWVGTLAAKQLAHQRALRAFQYDPAGSGWEGGKKDVGKKVVGKKVESKKVDGKKVGGRKVDGKKVGGKKAGRDATDGQEHGEKAGAPGGRAGDSTREEDEGAASDDDEELND